MTLMKPFSLVLLSVTFFSIGALLSCSKSGSNTPQNRLYQKWAYTSSSEIDTLTTCNGTPRTRSNSYYRANAGDYILFGNDGKIYTLFQNQYDTIAFRMLSDTLGVVMPGRISPADTFRLHYFTGGLVMTSTFYTTVCSPGKYRAGGIEIDSLKN